MVWLLPLAVFSAVINILYLTGSLYMMLVYDRVLTSRAVPTLIAISLVALLAFAIQGLLDAVRGRMLARTALLFDELAAPRIFKALDVRLGTQAMASAANQAPVRDLDQIRSFLTSTAPTALLDMPFVPIFLVGCFILHPALGLLTVIGAVLITAVAFWTDRASRKPATRLSDSLGQRHRIAEVVSRSGGMLSVLGLEPFFRREFLARSLTHAQQSVRATDVTASYGAGARFIRQVLQSASLGLGAYLAIRGEMSAGSIIAGSIMTSRALAPIEAAVANLKVLAGARVAMANLSTTVKDAPEPAPPLSLPAPRERVTAEQVHVVIPGQSKPLLQGVNVTVGAGDALAIIGPTGSGKTTLVRAILGLLPVAGGKVRLDGADLVQYGPELSRHVGYLPQDLEFYEGTIAQNIGRFEQPLNEQAIVEAAKEAGAHDLIVAMPLGYNTIIGPGGLPLSGGQRQRIALARALFGRPFLVILDEPNANLDSEGDAALNAAVQAIRQRGGAVIIVTHRPSALASVNLVAVLRQGSVSAIGPKDQILQQAGVGPSGPASRPQVVQA